MIVAHGVLNVGRVRTALADIAKQAQFARLQPNLTVLADRGYFSGEQIRECERVGIMPLVPKPLTSNKRAQGLFDKRDFVYDAKRDEFRCPVGKRAIWRMICEEKGLRLRRYWSSDCPQCPMKSKCTPSPYRRITR